MIYMINMNEIGNKYQIGVRRFNINWIGIYSLYIKETLRFLLVFGQTIVGPIITAILFLVVISLAIGPERSNVLGVNFISFLAPGLIAMQCISQSFAHSSSSILMGKVLSILVFYFFIDIKIENIIILILYLFLSSFILSSLGFIAGLWAEKFDHMATVTNFVIVPLSFLSGTFYSVERLPDILKTLSYYNPFFHMIDGFRYAFILKMDGSLKFGLIYLSILSIIIWLTAYMLYKKGYKVKT